MQIDPSMGRVVFFLSKIQRFSLIYFIHLFLDQFRHSLSEKIRDSHKPTASDKDMPAGSKVKANNIFLLILVVKYHKHRAVNLI